MKRNRENFFIWRYFMYFCSVAVIPVALTMFIYLDTVRIVKEEEYQSIVNAVEQNSKMIDEYIIGMRHLAINLRSNQQANDFFADGDPMRDPNCITDIINVQKYIASLLRLNSTFDDIFLYSEKSGALVTQSSAYTRLAEGYSPIHFGLEDTGSAGIDFLTTQYRDEFLYDACIGRKDTYGNYLVYADTVELAGYHRTIFVLLNNSRISQLFKQILDNSEGFLYITGRDGNVVLGEGLPDDTVLARVREKAAGEGGYFIQSVGGKKMFISYVKEEQNTFEYYFAMDLKNVLEKTESIRLLFGGMMAFALLMTLALIYIASIKTTKPINAIVDILQSSAKNKKQKYKFDDINEELRQIIAANGMMQQEILSLMDSQKNTVFYRLFNGHFETDEEYTNGISLIGLRGDQKMYAVVIVAINDANSSLEEISALKMLINRLMDSIDPNICGYFDIDFYKEAMIIPSNESSQEEFIDRIDDLANEVCAGLKENPGISISFVGSLTRKISKLHFAFEEAKIALSYRRANNRSKVQWFVKAAETEMTMDFFYPIETESKLIDAVISGNSKETRSIFSSLGKLNMEQGNQTESAQLQFLSSLLSTMYRIQKLIPDEYCGQVADKIRSFNESMSKSQRYLSQFYEMKKYCIELAGSIGHEQGHENSKLISEILSYIESNYTDPMISLAAVADIFSITEIYLSRLFKEQTGENFSKFIERLRMEKAQDMLAKTDMRGADISQAVGYNYVQVFNRVYKRNFGKTPSEIQKAKPHEKEGE